MNETEVVKSPDRNVDLELSSGGGVLLRNPELPDAPLRERARKPKVLPA
jgi:hypothetical protein